MNYIIWDNDDNPLSAALKSYDAAYLREQCLPTLQPITTADYINGFSVILHTAARYSYVLDTDKLYWLIEWEPGLLVLELSTKNDIRATALRSPNPYFGGRTPMAIDDLEYDEDEENHQYNLIFKAWDAQFNTQHRERHKFTSATHAERQQFKDALAYVNTLGDVAQEQFQNSYETYIANAKKNIATWAGDGIVITS